MDYQKFINILKGNFENIPKEDPKSVKIFLSSTFSGKIIININLILAF